MAKRRPLGATGTETAKTLDELKRQIGGETGQRTETPQDARKDQDDQGPAPGADRARAAEQEGDGEKTGRLKRLNVKLPADLHYRFKVKAVTEGKDMTELINAWVREYVNK